MQEKDLETQLNLTPNVRHKTSLMPFLLGRIYFFLVLGIKPRGLHMLNTCSASDFYSNSVFTFLKNFFFHQRLAKLPLLALNLLHTSRRLCIYTLLLWLLSGVDGLIQACSPSL